MGTELIAKNPCDFCKPPRRKKAPINAFDQEERTRMLRLAREAQPDPLGYMIELALTTGMRLSEVCAVHPELADREAAHLPLAVLREHVAHTFIGLSRGNISPAPG